MEKSQEEWMKMTPEEREAHRKAEDEKRKKQEELDAKDFKDVDTDEKFNRIIRVIQDNQHNNGYWIRRVVQLESEMRQMKTHEHGAQGDVVVKLKEMNNHGGSDSVGTLGRKSLLV